MARTTAQNYGIITLILLIITASLFYIDYYNERSNASASIITDTLTNWLRSATIDQEVLSQTSLKNEHIEHDPTNTQFFANYLTLPEHSPAQHYHISNSTIQISEVHSSNALETIELLTSQESNAYKFNRISPSSFYLNQVPASRKTHNFLGIIIDNIVFGFQYTPIEHQKVLEIIDALQQSE